MSQTLEEIRSGKSLIQKKRNAIVDYFGVQIEPWNHPASIAGYILKYIRHTHMFGCQFIAPMGHGKTTAATVIAHHIHKKRPEFQIHWAESSDFAHLKRFLLNLPKEPMVIIFDDITSALKQMSDKDIEKNFEDLTKIRWILDPEKGQIPIIVFVNYHYSKNLEKEFRSVLGMTVFLSFGSEEHTNIDTIIPKRSMGRKAVEYFSKISDTMFTRDEFTLLHSNGQPITYKTDDPCRPSCAVMGKDAKIILLSDKDTCKKCEKTHFLKYIDCQQAFEKTKNSFDSYGKKAWQIVLLRRGFLTFNPKLSLAINFIENNLLTRFHVKWDEMAELVIKENKTKRVRLYRKRKEEEAILEELEESSEIVPVEKTTSTSTNKEE